MLKRLALAGALALAACTTAAPLAEETATVTDAQQLTIERLFASPSLSGPTPRRVKFSPDGKRVTFLKAREDQADRFDLWQFDVETGAPSMLVDSLLLDPDEGELSEEEKALRERKRIAGSKGIVDYDWGTANTILVPLGGDLHLVTLPPASRATYTINVDPRLAANYALSEEDVLRQVEEASEGFGGSIIPPDDLRNLLLAAPDGSAARLSSLAEIVPAPMTPETRQLTDTDAFEYDTKVSPAGRYVSFVRDGAVYAIDLSTGAETRLTPEAEPDKAISYGVAEFVAQEEMSRYTGYWWSPNERYLAYTRVDESTVDIIPRFDITAGGTTVIEQRYPRAGRPNAVVDLFVRDMETGQVTEVAWRRDDWGPATDQYLARVNWMDGQVHVQAVNRDQTLIRYLEASAPNWRVEAYMAESQSRWVNLSDDFHLTADMLLYTSEEGGLGYRHILGRSRDGSSEIKITDGDWVVDRIVGIDAETNLVFFTGYMDTPLERHLYVQTITHFQVNTCPGCAGLQLEDGPPPSRLTEAGKSWSITMSPDGKSFVGTSSSPDQPPQTGLYRVMPAMTEAEIEEMGAAALPDSGCIDLTPQSARAQVHCPEPTQLIAWIEENALDETHPYFPYLGEHTVPHYDTLTAEDGQTLHYSIQKPPGFDPAKQYPVIVNVYGGPAFQTVDRDWERLTDVFYTQQGYIVFRLDNRGTTNRGKAFEDVIYRQMGIPEVRDQLLGVEWLKSLDFVDSDRIAIQGWSYGGYMTLMTLLQAEPGTFAAALSGAPVTDWSLYDTFYTERYMDTPQDNPDGYERGSVFYHLDRYEGDLSPLLLIHGMADDNVTFDNTTRLMAALQEAGRPFELMTYPGQRHGIRGEALQVHLMKTRMAFLDRHLKEDAP